MSHYPVDIFAEKYENVPEGMENDYDAIYAKAWELAPSELREFGEFIEGEMDRRAEVIGDLLKKRGLEIVYKPRRAQHTEWVVSRAN